ncbi:MAG: DUF1512 family protein [Candidatus Aenigmatarchaeota archaeon]
MILFQTEILGTIVWFFMFFVFIFLYPRLMLSQLIYKIEQSARKMEQMSDAANRMVVRKIAKKPADEMKGKVKEFVDFFVVEPSSIDPYGLVKKIDVIVKQMESRFDEFVDNVAGDKGYKDRQEINYGLRAAMALNQISKIVRHNVELAKKFKNLQIAMILQMQLPIIEKIAESELKGTEAFVNGLPIGDSIGPLVAASMIDTSREIAEDVVIGTKTIKGRKCFIMKAKGPAPHLGRIDDAIAWIMKRNKIDRIITIDAALKLEGEKSGSVAEGVGFAMGGFQRELIESYLLPLKKPIDSIVIKVGLMEAIMPMKKEIFDSLQKANGYVEKAVERTKKGGKIIIIGVGNSCGIGDTTKTMDDVKRMVIEIDKRYKKEEAQSKKGGRWI